MKTLNDDPKTPVPATTDPNAEAAPAANTGERQSEREADAATNDGTGEVAAKENGEGDPGDEDADAGEEKGD